MTLCYYMLFQSRSMYCLCMKFRQMFLNVMALNLMYRCDGFFWKLTVKIMHFNSSLSSATYMRQWTRSSLVQVIAGRRRGWLIVNWSPGNKFSEIWIGIHHFHLTLECGTWYHHPRRQQCVLSRNVRIFKVATRHYRCRHHVKNNCIWDNLPCCLLFCS